MQIIVFDPQINYFKLFRITLIIFIAFFPSVAAVPNEFTLTYEKYDKKNILTKEFINCLQKHYSEKIKKQENNLLDNLENDDYGPPTKLAKVELENHVIFVVSQQFIYKCDKSLEFIKIMEKRKIDGKKIRKYKLAESQ
jgi:hypothetical protein